MKNVLIVSVLGKDKPGLVEQLAVLISAQGGNWLESSFSRLAGQFAGIVKVALENDGAALLNALQALPDLDIRGVLDQDNEPLAQQMISLSLVGHDRIGIVKDVAAILARHHVNVEKLTTWLDSAPMSGDTMFHAQADLSAPASVDTLQLRQALEALADDLMVELGV
ncbi:glycine cleavage system protein R [Chitinibacter bivalviorum]|uniref:Glycine cleavage system protein R n=1 Tax=Chitinibacter bivalviorum TaxID=2739434 RepID=A0A7H9BLG3_9NEIS|nr:ACT domain-containing protein [Chitinibacter bivalviorum]QLG89520.1 glycine cleavage system protein R [Chitinibacter bivalviorum]